MENFKDGMEIEGKMEMGVEVEVDFEVGIDKGLPTWVYLKFVPEK